MKRLLPYLWPEGRWDLRTRVVIAMLLLVISKVITVLTPYAFKWATDALTTVGSPRHCRRGGRHIHGAGLWRGPRIHGGVCTIA